MKQALCVILTFVCHDNLFLLVTFFFEITDFSTITEFSPSFCAFCELIHYFTITFCVGLNLKSR